MGTLWILLLSGHSLLALCLLALYIIARRLDHPSRKYIGTAALVINIFTIPIVVYVAFIMLAPLVIGYPSAMPA